jgi:type IV secretion system protein TrbB
MLIETGVEERNGKDAAQGRRLEKLRRDFGPVFLAALNDPQTIEILLNADGTLWQEKLGGRMEPIGQMSATRAEAALRTIAACLNTVITWDHPMLEGELPLDGSRFAGPVAAGCVRPDVRRA